MDIGKQALGAHSLSLGCSFVILVWALATFLSIRGDTLRQRIRAYEPEPGTVPQDCVRQWY